jgi:spore coat-associated protein N
MKKILISLVMVVLAAGLIGGGVYAAFSNTETSTDNLLSSGTLDLKTNDSDGVSQTFYSGNLKPGDSIGPAKLSLRNTGTLNASALDIAFSYIKRDGAQPSDVKLVGIDKTADEYASQVLVVTLTRETQNLLSLIMDQNNNGNIDLYDLSRTSLTGLGGIYAGQSKNFTVKFTIDPNTGNEFQGDGVAVTMTFTLRQ